MLKYMVVFLLTVQLFGCSQAKRDHAQLLLRYQQSRKQLEARLDSLQRQEEISESYLASAQLNQVLRSADEKKRQLKNLNEYQVEIQKRMSEVMDSIKVYSDSVSLYIPN